MEKILNRHDVIKLVAAELKIPATHAHKITEAIENEIAKCLKSKGRVKFQGFGTFYLISRPSRTFKQVKTGISRILLEHQLIKFIAAPKLKGELMSSVTPHRSYPAERDASSSGLTASPQAAKSVKKPETQVPRRSANFKPVELKKFGVHQRLTREEFNKILRQRLVKLAGQWGGKPQPQAVHNDLTLEERLLIALIKRIEKSGSDVMDFSLTSSDVVAINAGKPRRLLANLPKSNVLEILKLFFDIDDFESTQERFVKLSTNSKIISDRWIQVHSLPTYNGASVYIKIFRRAEGD